MEFASPEVRGILLAFFQPFVGLAGIVFGGVLGASVSEAIIPDGAIERFRNGEFDPEGVSLVLKAATASVGGYVGYYLTGAVLTNVMGG